MGVTALLVYTNFEVNRLTFGGRVAILVVAIFIPPEFLPDVFPPPTRL